MISPELCIKCKGKLLCGLSKCPILEKESKRVEIVSSMKGKNFEGASPPSIFVSWKSYPKVSIAPLSGVREDTIDLMDSPEKWFGLPQEKIISMREGLLRAYKSIKVDAAANPDYDLIDLQEVALAENKVDVELKLSEKPIQGLSFDHASAPTGPSAKLDSMSFVANPKTNKNAEKFYHDTDAKSETALMDLFWKKIPVSTLSKMLSGGVFGVKKNRKLVPTRWSITAVDSTISKNIVEDLVKQEKVIDNIRIYNSKYLDNDFWVMLLPYPWAFEQMEAWAPNGVWTQGATDFIISADFELNKGLKGYPNETEGAYFASKLAVAEFLAERKEQSAAIVFREIGENYAVPLGVWQIRENVRNALKQKAFEFSTMNLALEFLGKKLKIPLGAYKQKSQLLKHFMQQKRISEWF
jgi:hypothetical protein